MGGPAGKPMRTALVQGVYVVAVGAVAAGGFIADSTAMILGAVLLALPTGIVGLIGYYLTYGVSAQVAGAGSSNSRGSVFCSAEELCQGSSTGGTALWFTHTMDLLGVLSLIAAAVLNVVLWRFLMRRRAGSVRGTPGVPTSHR